MLISGFGRRGKAKGDIPGVRFKVVKVSGVGLLALWKEKKVRCFCLFGSLNRAQSFHRKSLVRKNAFHGFYLFSFYALQPCLVCICAIKKKS